MKFVVQNEKKCDQSITGKRQEMNTKVSFM